MPSVLPRYPFGDYALNPCHGLFLKWAHAMPKNWWGRRGALALRKLTLKTRPYDRPIDAQIEDIKMRIHTTDNVSERKFLFLPQFFDAEERQLIRQTLSKNSTFVDIGANAGIYTLTAAQTLSAQEHENGLGEGRVLAFEPNPTVGERLQFNVTLNHFNDKVEIDPVGISDQAGHFTLNMDDSNLGGSSLVHTRSADKNSIEIACFPLFERLTHHKVENIDILKIDIEGAEDKALIPFFKDAPETLHPRYIIIENSSDQWENNLLDVFKQNGYHLFKTTRMNMIWQKPQPEASNESQIYTQAQTPTQDYVQNDL